MCDTIKQICENAAKGAETGIETIGRTTQEIFKAGSTDAPVHSGPEGSLTIYSKSKTVKSQQSGPSLFGSSLIFLAQAPNPKKTSSDEKSQDLPKKNKLSPTTKKIAKNLYQEGQKNYELGRFEDALDAFQRSYDLTQNPAFLYNIAQCNRQLLKIPEALASFRKYLDAEPNAVNKDQVSEAIKPLEKWEKMANEMPDETRKLFVEFQRLMDQFPEEKQEGYWPDFLKTPKALENSACGSTQGREKLIPVIMEQMASLLKDDDPRVVWAAALMLQDIALASSSCLPGDKLAEKALSALEGLINHPRPEIRSKSASAIMRMTDWIRRSGPHLPLEKLFAPPDKLLALLNDPTSQVRSEAVLALRGYRAAPQLLELFKREKAPEVRGALAEAFGSQFIFNSPDKLTPIDGEITKALIALSKENDFLAEKAIFALSLAVRKEPSRIWFLIRALDDPEPIIRLRGANGLENAIPYMTSSMKLEAIPKLKKLAANNFEGPCAASALVRLGETAYALTTLNDMIVRNEDPETRRKVTFYLEFIGTLPLYSDSRKGWLVPAEPVVSILKKLLQDKDPEVQNRARHALDKIREERKEPK